MNDMRAAWADVFGNAEKPVCDIAMALRALIHSIHPETVECAYPGYGSVNFGFGHTMKSDAYSYLMVQKGRVNLGFFRGASLPDPSGKLEGSGKALRHVKVSAVAMAADPDLRALVKAAIEERRRALTAFSAPRL